MLEWLKIILGDSYTEEIDKKVSAEIGKGFVSKTDFNAKNEELKTAQGQLLEAKKTIEGLSSALSAALSGLSETGVIRDAKNTVEDLADEKWEEYTGEDMTILNADIHAEKVSFTSGENPEPQSLQIILRTEGTKETEEDSVPAMSEDFQAEGNIFQRLWSILVRIAEAVAGVFRG